MADWGRITSRGNIEDRRGFAPAAVGGISLTGLALYMLVTYLSGGDMIDVINQLPAAPVEQRNLDSDQYQGEDSYELFASKVLGSGNDTWTAQFQKEDAKYTPPKLVLFREATQSGCGVATSQVGPHYCPIDQTIYLDETFFDELTYRFGAKGGDVAQAYVIAHEIGHHVQNELGTMDKVQNGSASNEDSIKLELQADCYAGLWANSLKDKQVFEPGEISEAIDAAAAVGDDRIQQKVTGYVNPETWTHGSSAQRVAWFNKGYESGKISSCDTFK